MDADKLMDGITNELEVAVRGMAKAKTVDEKLAYSKIIRNLTKSLEVFFDLSSDMMEDDEELEQ